MTKMSTAKFIEGKSYFSTDHEFIIRNSAVCRKCGDHIQSKYTHDFVSCKCGAISVDGGFHYLRRVGKPELFEDTSIMVTIEKLLWEARHRDERTLLHNTPTSKKPVSKSCRKTGKKHAASTKRKK